MEDKQHIILSVLNKILGIPKKEGDIKEFEYNCKSRVCRSDVDKFNLAYNSKNNIFHCWKCKYKGSVHKIAQDYGSTDDLNKINILIPRKKTFRKEKTEEFSDMITCNLPEGYKLLWKKSDSKHYRAAVKYATGKRNGERALSWETIRKFKIGYTEDKGKMRYRLIIPSYNNYGKINYYVGRSYYPIFKPSYMGPPKTEVARTEIIFNSKNINFDLPVILVEGVFDMFPLYNAIPMLGTEPALTIIKKLIEHKTRVILCLDEDALYDSIEIYNKLTAYGLEVYFVEIKDDIDEFHRYYGKQATIELLKMSKNTEFQKAFKEFATKEKAKIKTDDVVDVATLKSEWEEMKKDILKD